MNELESALYRTRKTIRQVCEELGLDFDTAYVVTLAECSSCDIWQKHGQLTDDLDGNPICKDCLTHYGM